MKYEKELLEISRLLKTQDNRVTNIPLFVVEQEEKVPSPDDGELYEWYDDDWNEVSESKAAELDEYLNTEFVNPEGYTKGYYKIIWKFVTACFTEQGCKDYLRLNEHNLRNPRIFVHSGYRNKEWEVLRDVLSKGLPELIAENEHLKKIAGVYNSEPSENILTSTQCQEQLEKSNGRNKVGYDKHGVACYEGDTIIGFKGSMQYPGTLVTQQGRWGILYGKSKFFAALNEMDTFEKLIDEHSELTPDLGRPTKERPDND